MIFEAIFGNNSVTIEDIIECDIECGIECDIEGNIECEKYLKKKLIEKYFIIKYNNKISI